MELGVFLMVPVTPSLPLPPRPTGQFGEAPAPTFAFHSGLILVRKSVQMKVVPLPSERWTTIMSLSFDGKFTPGFALAISGSFHRVIVPRKIPASAFCVNFSEPLTPGTL